VSTVRAEWIKLRSVRSTTWALLALVGVSVLFSTLTAWGSDTSGGSPGHPGDNDLVLDSLSGLWFGQIAVAVLGALAMTSEYSTRMIRSSLAAVPRRRAFLVSKAAVVGAIVLVFGLVTTVACFLVGQAIFRRNGFTYDNGYPHVSLQDADARRAVLGCVAYLTLLAVFALGIGAIVRHTAGAITLVLALVLAPVIAISFLPDGAADWVEKVSLMSAGLAMLQTVERPDNIPLDPWAGFAVVGAYAAGALGLALWLIARRDA
jgi:ABC-type transport system involved in multi-copper enzyme maturation permease subunit